MANKKQPDQNLFEQFGYNPDEILHEVDDSDDQECNCGCEGHRHTHAKVHKIHGFVDSKTGKRMCELEENKICTNCGACDMCDLDPTKVCDNCGKCLDYLETDEKGYVHVPVDKIITDQSEMSLDDLYSLYGLDDQDDEQ